MSIGEKIFELRTKANISQEKMGLDLGVSRQAISKWETNQSIPDLENIKMIATYFNVKISDLIDDNIEEVIVKPIENKLNNKVKKVSNIILLISSIAFANIFVSYILLISFQIPLSNLLNLSIFDKPKFVFPLIQFINLSIIVGLILITSILLITNKKTRHIKFNILSIIFVTVSLNLYLSSIGITNLIFKDYLSNAEIYVAYAAINLITSFLEPFIICFTILYAVGMSLSLVYKYKSIDN